MLPSSATSMSGSCAFSSSSAFLASLKNDLLIQNRLVLSY